MRMCADDDKLMENRGLEGQKDSKAEKESGNFVGGDAGSRPLRPGTEKVELLPPSLSLTRVAHAHLVRSYPVHCHVPREYLPSVEPLACRTSVVLEPVISRTERMSRSTSANEKTQSMRRGWLK